MKIKHNSFRCPSCKIEWQTWTGLSGKHQTFNKFAFKDFKDPEIKICNICESKEDDKRENV